MAKGDRVAPDATAGGASLGDLLKAKGLSVSTPAAPVPVAVAPPPPADGIDLSGCGKVVLRRERKGRGGKTATVVEGLGLKPKPLDAALRAMRKALGCGGNLEGDRLILHGDLPERAEAWLRAHGVKKTVIGN